MPSITLAYGGTSGSYTDTQAFSALSVKGFLPTDGHTVFPELRPVYLNGNVRKKQAGFRRIFKLDLGVITNANLLAFLGLFLNNEAQWVSTYSYANGITTESDLQVVDDHSSFESVWEGGVEVGRHVYLVLEEADMRTTYPASAGYGFGYAEDYGDGL